MGKQKYINAVESLFRKSPVVKSTSIERIVGQKPYTKQLLRKLVLKGTIKRIAKGYYTIHDEASLAVFCLKPAYLGLQDALSYHELWEQETVPVIITTRKVRPGLRKALGANVLIRRIEQKYFFGFEYSSDSFHFPYSDVEKTFIDLVYFKQKLSREILDSFRKKINKEKLLGYLRKYPKRMSRTVLKMVYAQRP